MSDNLRVIDALAPAGQIHGPSYCGSFLGVSGSAVAGRESSANWVAKPSTNIAMPSTTIVIGPVFIESSQ